MNRSQPPTSGSYIYFGNRYITSRWVIELIRIGAMLIDALVLVMIALWMFVYMLLTPILVVLLSPLHIVLRLAGRRGPITLHYSRPIVDFGGRRIINGVKLELSAEIFKRRHS